MPGTDDDRLNGNAVFRFRTPFRPGRGGLRRPTAPPTDRACWSLAFTVDVNLTDGKPRGEPYAVTGSRVAPTQARVPGRVAPGITPWSSHRSGRGGVKRIRFVTLWSRCPSHDWVVSR